MLKEHLEIFREHLENRFRRFQKYELICHELINDLNLDALIFHFPSYNFARHFDTTARRSEAVLVRSSPAISVRPARHMGESVTVRMSDLFPDTKTFAARTGHSEKPSRYINIINHHKSSFSAKEKDPALQIKKKWDTDNTDNTVFTFFLDLEST